MRNFNDPEYVKWRKEIFKRDGFKCQMPNCKGKKVQAHHIQRWVDAPLLRYELSNGITLCKYHHKLVTGKEEEFRAMFQNIVLQKNKVDMPLDLYFELQRRLRGLDDN